MNIYSRLCLKTSLENAVSQLMDSNNGIQSTLKEDKLILRINGNLLEFKLSSHSLLDIAISTVKGLIR